ncbi:SDR family NAD(P)-dependent oxidoreductase, partial [Burkholderia cenocepacia]|uniref:SDR family NAD(P)-dependent oxidoreductase n=1 Tax=Burkholderia cenocepacia TaxID=95486 RepID=UPI00222E62A1
MNDTSLHEAGAGRLQGKIAIVTGAGCVGPGWGNGRAVAALFAAAGAKIFAVDINMDAMAETVRRVTELGGEITAHMCDVTNSAAVAAMVDACRETY